MKNETPSGVERKEARQMKKEIRFKADVSYARLLTRVSMGWPRGRCPRGFYALRVAEAVFKKSN